MQFRFNVGDEVFIASRYDGIQRVKIVAQIKYEECPCYELDNLIQVHKDGHAVGAAEYRHHEREYYFPAHTEQPCPENMLFIVGDKNRNSMSNLLGSSTDETFTQEMADQIA